MEHLYIQLGTMMLVYASSWFLVSVVLQRNDIADIAWGLGYILVCAALYVFGAQQEGHLLLYSLITIWGLRLSLHIFFRNQHKSEDFRYRQWRFEWGSWFYLRSYLQVFLLQAAFLLIIISPVIASSQASMTLTNPLTLIGLSVWIIGFIFESVADHQLKQFLKEPQKGAIMTSGLWRYSRHPNYFGEATMWWGIWIISIPSGYWWAIISPLLITFLLRFVSGVPMLEQKYEGNAAYERYQRETNTFVPWFVRK